jgi:hypothetical protein
MPIAVYFKCKKEAYLLCGRKNRRRAVKRRKLFKIVKTKKIIFFSNKTDFFGFGLHAF